MIRHRRWCRNFNAALRSIRGKKRTGTDEDLQDEMHQVAALTRPVRKMLSAAITDCLVGASDNDDSTITSLDELNTLFNLSPNFAVQDFGLQTSFIDEVMEMLITIYKEFVHTPSEGKGEGKPKPRKGGEKKGEKLSKFPSITDLLKYSFLPYTQKSSVQ